MDPRQEGKYITCELKLLSIKTYTQNLRTLQIFYNVAYINVFTLKKYYCSPISVKLGLDFPCGNERYSVR